MRLKEKEREREREREFSLRVMLFNFHGALKKRLMHRARGGGVYCKINETRKRKLPIISLKKR